MSEIAGSKVSNPEVTALITPVKAVRAMRRPSLLLLIILLNLLALTGCDDNTIITPRLPDTVRVSFQDGALPSTLYHGTADAVLKNGPTNDLRNGNFGAALSDTVGTAALPYDLFERRLVIRMNLTSITNCSQVLSARLSIHLAPGASAGLILEAHKIIRPDYAPWTEGFGGVAAGVSWTTIDGSAPWSADGGDFDGAVIDQKTISGDTVVTFSLNPSLVRGWIAKPASNHGVVIKTADASTELAAIAYFRENSMATRRPRLDITYLSGG